MANSLDERFSSEFDDWRDQWVAVNGEPPDPRQTARAIWDRAAAAEARAEAAEKETARLRAACQEDAAYLAEIDDLVASSGYDPDWNPEYPVTPYTLDCDPKGVLNRLTEHLARLKRIEAAAIAWNDERKKVNDRSRTGEMRLDILRLTADLDAALEEKL